MSSKFITFKEVCNFIKNNEELKIIKKIDDFLGLVLITSPILFGPKAFGAIGLISAKNEIIKIATNLISGIQSISSKNEMEHYNKLRVAFWLIHYTAFFEAVARIIPIEILNEVDRLYSDKEKLINTLRSAITSNPAESIQQDTSNEYLYLPYNDDPCPGDDKRLRSFYEEIWKVFSSNINKIFKESEVQADFATETLQAGIIYESIREFKAQYLALSNTFPAFLTYVQINNFTTLLNTQSHQYQIIVEMLKNMQDTTSIGFNDFNRAIKTLNTACSNKSVERIINNLKGKYKNETKKPIVKEEATDKHKTKLIYPAFKDIFIPQQYKILIYDDPTQDLDSETTWKNLIVKEKLAVGLFKHFSSEHAYNYPLLILGHPGGGKSLLTQIIAANIIDGKYVPIRISLKDIDPNKNIFELIKEQIYKDAQESIDWPDFASNLDNKCPLIIFDGFDELLQVSGKDYKNFINTIHEFQLDELNSYNRPAMTLITSRISLIDAADIPLGTTVIRLLEFNDTQIYEWIKIWNIHNGPYYRSQTPNIRPFSIPTNTAQSNNKIDEMARQPLLLLMLAIYDSDGNSLRNSINLDRTYLYNNLLRRFLEREILRYHPKLKTNDDDTLGIEIETEMRRLGVCAIGMFNRHKLSIKRHELSNDLVEFNLCRKISSNHDKPLSDEEILIGTFFFIHKASAIPGANKIPQLETYEFLHQTFCEFLIADFIITSLINAAQGELIKTTNINTDWAINFFSATKHTDIHSRTNIVSMIQEWFEHVANKINVKKDELVENIHRFANNTFAATIGHNECYNFINRMTKNNPTNTPLPGILANTTLNLITLITTINNGNFAFNEHTFSPRPDDQKHLDTHTTPWNRLTCIWKSWFTTEKLAELSAYFETRLQDNSIEIQKRKTPNTEWQKSKIDSIILSANVLIDQYTSAITTLHTPIPAHKLLPTLNTIETNLKYANVDLGKEIELYRLRHHIQSSSHITHEIENQIKLITNDNTLIRHDLIPIFLNQLCSLKRRGYIISRHTYNAIIDFLQSLQLNNDTSNACLSTDILYTYLEIADNKDILQLYNSTMKSISRSDTQNIREEIDKLILINDKFPEITHLAPTNKLLLYFTHHFNILKSDNFEILTFINLLRLSILGKHIPNEEINYQQLLNDLSAHFPFDSHDINVNFIKLFTDIPKHMCPDHVVSTIHTHLEQSQSFLDYSKSSLYASSIAVRYINTFFEYFNFETCSSHYLSHILNKDSFYLHILSTDANFYTILSYACNTYFHKIQHNLLSNMFEVIRHNHNVSAYPSKCLLAFILIIDSTLTINSENQRMLSESEEIQLLFTPSNFLTLFTNNPDHSLQFTNSAISIFGEKWANAIFKELLNNYTRSHIIKLLSTNMNSFLALLQISYHSTTSHNFLSYNKSWEFDLAKAPISHIKYIQWHSKNNSKIKIPSFMQEHLHPQYY